MNTDFPVQESFKINVKGSTKIKFVLLKDIIKIQCDGYISILHTKENKTIAITKLLKEFEKDLCGYGFIRISRSLIVNLTYVAKYKGGPKRTIELINGEYLTVSRRRVYLFRKEN